MKQVRVAIIGTGVISHRHMQIYENINRNSEYLGFTAKVVAAAEIDPIKLRAFGEKYSIQEQDLYTDFRKMLQRDDIDTVDVCVHNNYHTPISIEVMRRGFDCYTEKPAAASYHDAKMMADAAKVFGRRFHVQISSIMRYQSRLAKRMIEEGKLGDVYYVNLESVARRWRPGYDVKDGMKSTLSEDFCSAKIAGHGKSIDIGVYLISQILFVLGLPRLESVTGFSKTAIPWERTLLKSEDGFSVEDIADGFARFENGTGFHYLTASAANTPDYNKTYILGTRGGFELNYTDTYGGKLMRAPGVTFPMPEPSLIFHGEMDGQDVTLDLRCAENEVLEQRLHPEMMLYNDNQCMWLAYKLGIFSETERYNTPEIAMEMLLLSDGLFLSDKQRRSVTRDEIISFSPKLYLDEQEIDGQIVHYDTSF